MVDPNPSILFVCVHNAGRSQMAAGFASVLGQGRVDVLSAGSEPADRVNPVAPTIPASHEQARRTRRAIEGSLCLSRSPTAQRCEPVRGVCPTEPSEHPWFELAGSRPTTPASRMTV